MATARRLTRNVILGAFAAGAGIWWLADALGLDRDVLWSYLTTGLVFVGTAIVLAMVVAAVWQLIRRLMR